MHSALQLRGKAEAKELPFSFSWEAEGALLRLWLVTASRPTYEASPSFASCYALATAKSRPSPKPSPTPLHVRCCCAMRSFIRRYRAARFLV